ncbi:hypothetical protein FQR65_LT18230 [Abscondita terminalis]|nr:hypothetical protein FQR65_LT18230 [Abscondita terminalis]
MKLCQKQRRPRLKEKGKVERQWMKPRAKVEHHRNQREQWEIRQLDHDLLQQRHSERERERELKEQAEHRLLLADVEDDYSLQSVIGKLLCIRQAIYMSMNTKIILIKAKVKIRSKCLVMCRELRLDPQKCAGFLIKFYYFCFYGGEFHGAKMGSSQEVEESFRDSSDRIDHEDSDDAFATDLVDVKKTHHRKS